MHQGFQPARRAALLSITGALAACGGGGSGDNGAPPQTVGQVIHSSLRSSANGNTYPIQVYLPQSYATGTATLPVIYATEGDAPYGSSSPYFNGSYGTRFDAFKDLMQRRGTQAILVGIGGTAWRATDFLVPGASRYLDFIVKELAVSIERQYRADPKRRVLSGLSHGGYFVLGLWSWRRRRAQRPAFHTTCLPRSVWVNTPAWPECWRLKNGSTANRCPPPSSSLARETETIHRLASRCTTRWLRRTCRGWCCSRLSTMPAAWGLTYRRLKMR